VKTAEILAPPVLVELETGPEPVLLASDLKVKLSALIALTKPRIALMVLVTVAVGFLLGTSGGSIAFGKLALTLVGTGLVAGGASAWNMILERDRDARMKRTANRPLPSGKLSMVEAVVFGSALALGGVALLFFGVNGLSAMVAASTFFLYVVVYTPMKSVTSLNTAIGAVPGALPPVIGWAASTGRLGVEPWALFLIVFLWQFPHFLAIAWIYRDDYARGGHKMLPNVGDVARPPARSRRLDPILDPPRRPDLFRWGLAAGFVLLLLRGPVLARCQRPDRAETPPSFDSLPANGLAAPALEPGIVSPSLVSQGSFRKVIHGRRRDDRDFRAGLDRSNPSTCFRRDSRKSRDLAVPGHRGHVLHRLDRDVHRPSSRKRSSFVQQPVSAGHQSLTDPVTEARRAGDNVLAQAV
jgi:protoheme IX farnesyltransferase